MRRRSVLLAGLVLLLSGCGISKDQYLKTEGEKKQLEQDNEKLSRKVNQLEREKEEISYYNQSLQSENRRLQQQQAESAVSDSKSSEEPLK